MNRLILIAAAAVLLCPFVSHAQTAPTYQGQDGQTKEALGTFPVAGAAVQGANAAQSQGTAASGATNAGNPVKVGCAYNATPPTVATGQVVDSQCNNRGFNLYVAAPDAGALAGVAPVASAAVSGGVVLKASAGNLYGFNVTSGASAGYVLVLNTATVPADGAVTPLRCFTLAANTSIEASWRAAPLYLTPGITVVFSTTGCFTKTASATAFISGDAK